MGLFSSLFKQETIEESRAKLYSQYPHLGLRVAAANAYNEGWKLGISNEKSLEACHELASINVIIRMYESVSNGQKMPMDKMVEVAGWEVLPFIKLPRKKGEEALMEYIVWRQYPESANMKVLLAAIDHFVQHLKSGGDEYLLEQIRGGEVLSWLPWKKLASLGA